MFNVHHEKSIVELERAVRQCNTPQRARAKVLLETMLEFARHYDWGTCHHLISVLEDRRVPRRREDFEL